MKRNNDFIREWIAALRSGTYNQTQSRLHNEKGYCCLGVACEIGIKKGLVEVNSTNEYNYDYLLNIDNLHSRQEMVANLSSDFAQWIGLIFEECEWLVNMNDDRHYDFNQIADWLEEKILEKEIKEIPDAI